MLLDLSQIEVNEKVNVRPYSTTHHTNDEGLAALITSIRNEGQIEPVVVRVLDSENDRYELIAGHRRLAAIRQINQERLEAGDEPMHIFATTSTTMDPFRLAFDENDKRQQMNPMDKAMNFAFIRQREKWTGAKGDKKVAEYFGVDFATVTQYKKLEKLTPQIQDQIASGVLTVDAALVLAKTLEETKKNNPTITDQELAEQADQTIAQAQVVEAAKQREAEEENAVGEVATASKRSTKKRQAKGGKKGISAGSMRTVAREQGVKISRKRSDILEWVESETGPAYKEHVRDFLTYFIKWADGNGTDRTLSAKFREAIGKQGIATQVEVKANKAVVVRQVKTA